MVLPGVKSPKLFADYENEHFKVTICMHGRLNKIRLFFTINFLLAFLHMHKDTVILHF